MNVLISQAIYPEGVQILKDAGLTINYNQQNTPLKKLELIQQLKQAQGLVCLLTDQIDAEVIASAPDLKAIANVAVGYNNIDVHAASEHGVLVTNTPDVLNDATADLTFALLLAAARRIPEAHAYTVAGKFNGWELFQPHLGLSVTGQTLGIVGMGRIGQAVAKRAQGFNMRVLYYNRHQLESAQEDALGATYVSFDTLLADSDFVSVHVPLTDETKHLFNREAFKRMRSSAVIINTARGPVIDEAALAQALEAGEIAGAALDVFEEEPVVNTALLSLRKHVVLTPHIGSATVATRRAMSVVAAKNLVAALQGERPPHLVNAHLWRT